MPRSPSPESVKSTLAHSKHSMMLAMPTSLPPKINQNISFLDSSNYEKVIPYAVLISVPLYLSFLCSTSGLGGSTGQAQTLLPLEVLPRP